MCQVSKTLKEVKLKSSLLDFFQVLICHDLDRSFGLGRRVSVWFISQCHVFAWDVLDRNNMSDVDDYGDDNDNEDNCIMFSRTLFIRSHTRLCVCVFWLYIMC